MGKVPKKLEEWGMIHNLASRIMWTSVFNVATIAITFSLPPRLQIYPVCFWLVVLIISGMITSRYSLEGWACDLLRSMPDEPAVDKTIR